MQVAPTLIVSEFARNAHNAQLFGSYPSILAKELELVTNFDNQESIHVFPLDIEKLDFHRRKLASLGTLLLALGRWWFVLLSLILSFGVITLQAWSRTVGGTIAPLHVRHAVWMAKLLDKLLVQLLLLPSRCRIFGLVLVGCASL